MSAEIFVPEEILASAEKSDGSILSILVSNDNTDQELNYIPQRIQLCGVDSSDENIVIPVLMNSNRNIF